MENFTERATPHKMKAATQLSEALIFFQASTFQLLKLENLLR